MQKRISSQIFYLTALSMMVLLFMVAVAMTNGRPWLSNLAYLDLIDAWAGKGAEW